MKTILITGFDPFGGEPINPAWKRSKQWMVIPMVIIR